MPVNGCQRFRQAGILSSSGTFRLATVTYLHTNYDMPATVLIVDDEKHTREGLMLALEDEYDVYLASDAEEAFRIMESEPLDVVLTDLRMAGKSGMKVIDRAISLNRLLS